MESITDLAPEIQKRVSNFVCFLRDEGMKLPEVKFIGSILSAMLKIHHVHVAALARSLGETIAPKKTWERLNRHLSKRDIGEKLLDLHLKQHASQISRMPYCVIDVSDIQKPEATQMEGLSQVRDGSKSSRAQKPVIGNGYHWINGVMVNEQAKMVPVHGEIYSLDYEGKEHMSENKKILAITDTIYEHNLEVIFIIDRGGDRMKLFKPMLRDGKYFIIRGDAKRSLRVHKDARKATNIEVLARRIKTPYCFTSERNGERFYIGVRRVYLYNKALWLVVSRREGCHEAISWYLVNVPGSRTTVMMTVMKGYSLRWRVEEYHRQIKQNYRLESICLRMYHAIKNMGVIVMLAASFCACLPYHLVIKLLLLSNQLPRKRLSDIPRYPYYMITAAVSQSLSHAVKRRPQPVKKRIRDYFQLKLYLEYT